MDDKFKKILIYTAVIGIGVYAFMEYKKIRNKQSKVTINK
jgi:hypothetical protein